MNELGLIINLGDLSNDKCIMCNKCKITPSSFKSVERSTNVLDLVHSNICEMIDTFIRWGKRYFITFIDNASKYTYVFLIRTKDETFKEFKSYKAEVELNLKIKTLRSDQGGEYIDLDFTKFYEEQIKR